MFGEQEKEEKKKSTIMEEFQEIDVTVGKLLEFVERFEKRFYPILEPINTAEPARSTNAIPHVGCEFEKKLRSIRIMLMNLFDRMKQIMDRSCL